MSRKNDAERQEALDRLRKWFAPGDTVYTIIRHVSRSGMQRRIGVVLLQRDGDKLIDLHPNWAVAKAVGARFDTHHGNDSVIVNGCGMDMGFHLVYETSHAMFPDGFGCIGEGCHSNDHANGDRDYTPHTCTGIGYFVQQHDAFNIDGEGPHKAKGAACHWHRDGGYALRQRWL